MNPGVERSSTKPGSNMICVGGAVPYWTAIDDPDAATATCRSQALWSDAPSQPRLEVELHEEEKKLIAQKQAPFGPFWKCLCLIDSLNLRHSCLGYSYWE